MREIVFRGKKVNDGMWIQGYLFQCWGRAYILWGMTNDTPTMHDVKPETVGQFTGLVDKNGKMIFEGDIVRFIWWWFDGAERESELTGTIVYSSDNMSFQLKGVKNKEWRDFVGADEHDMDYLTPFSELNFCDADFEIIGNIHDNPELLT